ncbi:hypothetical protein BCR37DRAFT_394443 [Protomyces lactucae-debilis]|uniref:Uncharacterized protein n=1 Tax=Protomyces lactucae-debilis TaxID=2754530 RepID=A0A1Y2F5H7_PROLT|nr:uncharacterized protein BCR37DRAFT_394443 [Protomyces lactucae-debilis]ORY79113.1 hypothetical protein BCR37DRAFT_394443 [Protomyces lactucae-debilis]
MSCSSIPKAAIDAKVKVFSTVRIKSLDAYKLEVDTLTSVVKKYGCNFLSIGVKDIVRADITSKKIAPMIEDARKLSNGLNYDVFLTLVETFQQSLQYDYKEEIAAVDFLSVVFNA